MNVNDKALIKLLRISIGRSDDFDFPLGVDWNEVFELSLHQGVVAITVVGINRCRKWFEEQGKQFILDSLEWEDLKYKWLGYSICYEKGYADYLRTLGKLTQFFSMYGMRVMVLKGYGLSLYYPVPSLRPKGDIDIYMLGNEDMGARKADRLVADVLGLTVTKSKLGHHSHFAYMGITVENHYELSNTYFGRKRSKYLEDSLKMLVEDGCRQRGSFFLPSATFNAVFLVWHMATHFCVEKISLRQLCDWILFLEKEHESIDWNVVDIIWKKSGLKSFADVVNDVAVAYFGMDENIVPIHQEQHNIEDRVIEDILHSTSRSTSMLRRIVRYGENGWKYRLTTGRCWIYSMLSSARMHIFHKEDLVEKDIFE